MVQNFPGAGQFSGAVSPGSNAADQTFSIFADTVALTRKFHRQIMEQIPDANYLKDGLLEDLIAGGGLLGVASDTINVYHAEQDSVVANVTVTNVAAGSGATINQATLTITPTTLSDGTTTKYFNYATVGQIFSTNDPGVQAVVVSTSISPDASSHTIVVQVKSGLTIANYISAGDILRPLGNVVGPNADFGTGSMRGWSRFGVEFQTMETVAGPLPTNAYNQTFEFTLANGQNIIAPRVLLDAYVQDDLKKMAQVLTGTGEVLNGQQTTMGIFKTIQTFGLTADYAPGALQWNDFITLNDQLRNRGAGTDRDLWMGAKVFDTIQNNFSSKFAYGIRYFQNADEKARLGVGFAEFASSEATYTMKKLNELNHPRIFSTSGASTSQLQNNYYANCFMVVPNTKVKVQSGLSSRTQSVEAPMFRVLQLEAPVTVGGPKVMKRVYNQAGAELSKENYKVTMRQDFAVQVMLAFKCFFGGTTSIS
jgi:hypothetical protein